MSTTTITSNISGICGTVRTNGTAPTAPGGVSCNVVTSSANVTTSITQDNIGGVTESGDSIVLPPHVKRAKITLPTYSVSVSNSTSDYSFSLADFTHVLNGGSTTNNVTLKIHCIDGNGAELGNVTMNHLAGITFKSNLVGASSYSHSLVRQTDNELSVTSILPQGTMTITPLGESVAERTILFQLRATDTDGTGRYGARTLVP